MVRFNLADEPTAVGTGRLYDPRTKARVPLTVEELLGTRPFGQTYMQPDKGLVLRPDTQALIQKLNLL